MTTPRGEYVVAEQMIVGRAAADLLDEILPRAIAEIPWPKTMYWTGASGLRFIRPIRWVVALLTASRYTLPLRTCDRVQQPPGTVSSAKTTFRLPDISDYVSKLRKNFVLAHPDESAEEGRARTE